MTNMAYDFHMRVIQSRTLSPVYTEYSILLFSLKVGALADLDISLLLGLFLSSTNNSVCKCLAMFAISQTLIASVNAAESLLYSSCPNHLKMLSVVA